MRTKSRRWSAALGIGVAAVAVGWGGAAQAAPTTVGPSLQLPFAPPAADVRAVALSRAGDALVMYAPRPKSTLRLVQRRGPRGAFGAPTVLTAAGPGPSSAALHANGDAAIVQARPAGGFATWVRRGWAGPWRQVATLAAPPGAEAIGGITARTGEGFDLAWSVQPPFDRPSESGTVQTARLTGGRWHPAPAHTLPPGPFTAARDDRGAILAVGGTDGGDIWAVARPTGAAAWEPATPLAAGAPPPFVPGGGGSSPAAGIGADGSLLASWRAGAAGEPLHGWIARRRPGAPAWDAPLGVGVADFTPQVTTGPTGELAAVWTRDPMEEEVGGPLMLIRQAPGAPWPAGRPIAPAGLGVPSLAADGTLIVDVSLGTNTASLRQQVLLQRAAGAPVRLIRRSAATVRAAARTPRFAFQAQSRDADPVRPTYFDIDQLGPVGLVAPARARAGAAVGVRVHLWRPTRVAITVARGAARTTITRRLPAGRSVVRMRMPHRAGPALVVATAREQPRSAPLRQRATIRLRAR